MSLLEDLKHLSIPFQEIKKATKNFTTEIGRGGYGPVYRGQLSLFGELKVVAVKKLQSDQCSGQGRKEFLTELQMLSRYKHQNIVSLVGFCVQGNERFLIYEYAEHGSLDYYLNPTKNRCPLTWKERINICVDAARGLDHLHNHVAKNQRVIHRDIKSANILLDHNWKAMVADFGFSKLGRANESVTYLVTNACGTYGYCDPAYISSGILTKECDIYSFGVVLFEVLCGRLCSQNIHDEYLGPFACFYQQKKLDLIIDDDLKIYMNSYSMNIFLDIAIQCLQDDRKQRPSMGLVLQKLEKALKFIESKDSPELLELEEELGLQNLVETLQLRELVKTLELEIGESRIVHEVIKAVRDMPNAPFSGITRDNVYLQLSTGILVDKGKVWFSIDDDGKTQEIISAIKLMPLDGYRCRTRSEPESRFSKVVDILSPSHEMHVKIRPQFLSSDVTYAAYLVCKPNAILGIEDFGACLLLYRLNYKSESFISYPSKMEDSGWWMFELFQTINFNKSRDLVVSLKILARSSCDRSHLLIEGIQFLPILKLEDEDEIDISEEKNLSPLEWDNRLPSDYKQFINYPNKEKMNKPQDDVSSPTKEEAYSILSRGVVIKIEDGDEIDISEEKTLSPLNKEWDNRLPSNYKQFINYSNKEKMKKLEDDVSSPTKEEASSIFSRRVLTSDITITVPWRTQPLLSEQHRFLLFWITKLNGKKCLLLLPTLVSYENKQFRKVELIPSNESRIGNVLHLLQAKVVGMRFEVPRGLLSTNTTYGCYLVYKMPQGSDCKLLVEMKLDENSVLVGQHSGNLTNFSRPQIPVIGAKGVCRSTRPSSNPKNIQLPRKRKDGWLEVAMNNIQEDGESGYVRSREKRSWKYLVFPCISPKESGDRTHNDTGNSFTLEPRYFKNITIWIRHVHYLTTSPKLIVQGIEFRPV